MSFCIKRAASLAGAVSKTCGLGLGPSVKLIFPSTSPLFIASSRADSPEENVAPAFKTFPTPSKPTSNGFTVSSSSFSFVGASELSIPGPVSKCLYVETPSGMPVSLTPIGN